MRHYKSLIVGVLLAVSFLMFNHVPDVVIMIWSTNHTVFYVVALLWSVGYLIDPLVYIFASNESRDVARTSVIKVAIRIGE